MSSVFPITDDPRYRRYTASAGQTVFPIPFPFLQGEDLKICLQTAPSEYTIFDPADYTLSGDNDPAGGTVTLDTGRAAGDVILVLGEAILDRMSSIVRDGRFSSSLIDSELDRIRIIEQEFRRDNGRSVKVDYGGTGLTLAADLQDGELVMKSGDRLVAGPDASEVANAQASAEQAATSAEEAAASAAQAALFDGLRLKNVAALLADTSLTYNIFSLSRVSPGDIVRTKAEGFAYSVAPSAASDHHISTAGGVKLYVLPGSKGFNVRAFGAVADGVANDTVAFAKAIAAASTGNGYSIVCNGSFRTTSTLTIAHEGVAIVSTNVNGGRFIRNTDFGPTFLFSNGSTQLGYVGLDKIYIVNTGAMTVTSGAAVVFDTCYGIVVQDCYIKDCFSGIDFLGVANGYVDRLNISAANGAAAGRHAVRIGYSANGSRFGGDLFFENFNFWCGEKEPGEGVGIIPHMDYGFKIECVDGLWLTAGHVIATALANYAIGNSAGHACQNIFADEAMSDISRGDGIRFEGTQAIYSVKWSGRVSGMGQTDPGKNGLSIVAPCNDLEFNSLRIDEFDGNGVFIDNANARNITFSNLKVFACNRDTDSDGSSININQGALISFTGGHLRGSGMARWAYKFGGGASEISVVGMRARDHVDGAVSISNGAGFITFTDTDLANNTNMGGVVVSKPASVPGLIFKDCLGYTPLVATQAWTPGAIANLGQAFVAVPVAGAELGDFVEVSASIDLGGTTLKGYVSGSNGTIVVCNNFTGATVTLGAMTIRVKVEKRTF